MQSTRSVLKRRSLQFLLVLTLPLVFLLAAARADAATQKLPDLEQQVPKQVQIGGGSGGWQIGFLSEVVNRGSGPLEIHGHRSGTSGNMTADQIIYMSDGTKQTVGGAGDLHYETGFGHQHWHFEPFDHYELRTLAGSLIGTDEKEGFCLGDNNNHGGGSAVYGATVEPTFCQQNNPSALSLTEGISPGWGDSYDPLKEGQDVPIAQSSSPTGDYNLVHRVNENSNGSHAGVQEASFGNNVASAEIHLSWSNGKPTVSVLKTCMGTALCGPVPPPPPPPPPPPGGGNPPGGGSTPKVTVDTTAPSLVLQKSSLEHFGGRNVFVYATCSERCTFIVQGTISVLGPARAMRTGKTTTALNPGQRSKISMHLTRKARARIRHALAHHKRVRIHGR